MMLIKNSFLLTYPILHFLQMIEKCRATIQSQFDQWYANLHARNGMIGNGTGASSSSSAHTSAYAYSEQPSMQSTASYGNGGLSMSMDSDLSTAPGRRVPSLQFDDKAGDSKAQYSPRGHAPPQQVSTQGSRASAVPAHLAESKDDDVNEDIKLFYQAKEEMLRRRGGAN